MIGASEVASSTAGAATFDSIFASAAAEVGLSSEGVAGAEVQGASWAERAGSLASKAGAVGGGTLAVAKASPYILTSGDVASRVMTGEGVGEAGEGSAPKSPTYLVLGIHVRALVEEAADVV